MPFNKQSILSTVLLAALSVFAHFSSGLAAEPREQSPESRSADLFAEAVVTSHSGVFDGEAIRYNAIVESTEIAKADGAPGARIVSISYVADIAADKNRRPVLFVFNGGPISASLWLHIGAVGPQRVSVPEDLSADPESFALADNPYSPLDAADLVFFDPAGTGFSEILPGADPEDYRSVVGDGQQLTAFIVAG